MAIKSFFFDAVEVDGKYDREYTSENFCDYLNKLVGNGVFTDPSTNLQVLQNTGMSVTVKAGDAWSDGHKMVCDADFNLDLEASDVTLPRIDAIVWYCDHDLRDMGVKIKKGDKASTPIAPAMIRNDRVKEYCLATVFINKQTTTITQANITDTRMDSAVCGYVRGLVQNLDTATLFLQWQASQKEQLEASQKIFDDWFNLMRETLSSSTLLRRFSTVVTTTVSYQNNFAIEGVPNFNYEIDLLEVYVNGFRLALDQYTYTGERVTLNNPPQNVGTRIEIIVYKCVDGKDAITLVEQVEELQTNSLSKLNGGYIEGKTRFKNIEIDNDQPLSFLTKDGKNYEAFKINSGGEFTINGFTFSGNAVLRNNIFIKGKKTDGSSLAILGISSDDDIVIGSPLLRSRIRSSVTPIWDSGTTYEKLITESTAIKTYSGTDMPADGLGKDGDIYVMY